MTNKASLFQQLHQGPDVLLLPNCWDAGSARLLESLGAKAVATTSAGLAWSLGYPDGDALPIRELVAAVERITRAVGVPLTVDMEAGYSNDVQAVGEAVAGIVGAGGVGINLEDAAGSADLLAAKVESARRAADRAGVPLFINARTDVYLRGLVPEGDRIRETLARAAIFRSAGASGFFVPKVVSQTDIAEIAKGAGLPLNVLAWQGLAAPPRLAELGVRRLTSGSAIALNAWSRAKSAAEAFLRDGDSTALMTGATAYAEVNALFTGIGRPQLIDGLPRKL